MKINKDYLFTQREINMMKLSKMQPVGITIHNTANTAPAINEAKNQFNNNTRKGVNGVAVHFYVDEKDIYQLIPINYHGWHSSDGVGTGNKRTIAIEICRSTDYKTDRYAKAELNAVELVKYLLKQTGLKSNSIKRHYDYAISKKQCPHRMFEHKPHSWQQFLALVEKPVTITPPKPEQPSKANVTTVAKQIVRVVTDSGYNHKELLDEVNRLLKPVVKPIPKPPVAKKEYVQLNKNIAEWGFYKLGTQPIKKNIIGYLKPQKFGGLEYEVLGKPFTNVVTIATRDYGKINIWIGTNNAKLIKR